jgi:hypothetical protein
VHRVRFYDGESALKSFHNLGYSFVVGRWSSVVGSEIPLQIICHPERAKDLCIRRGCPILSLVLARVGEVTL